MKARSFRSTSDTAARPVLLWVFRKDYDAITCEVDVNSTGTCEVRTVPQWNTSLAVVEPFARPGDALRRHAEVAARLRDLGWASVDHVPVAA